LSRFARVAELRAGRKISLERSGKAADAEQGLDPSLIEKDYWAVEALRAVPAGSASGPMGRHRPR